MVKIKRALLSVSDKTNLIPFAKALRRLNVEIISTGGTQKLLRRHGIPVLSVSEVTGFPEILDGRVKTLHPSIYGGLLFLRGNKAHAATVKQFNLKPIDLVVVNLYPFQKTVANPKTTLEEAIEKIDIGGPSMLRAAAKNHRSVAVLSDPADYAEVARELHARGGGLSEETLAHLAVKAFEHTARYDRAISHYFRKKFSEEPTDLPPVLDVSFEKSALLRYGENPHQRAALYRRVEGEPKFSFRQLHGKELSYNNILDLDSAVDVIREFEEPAACVVKHNNPSGVASDTDLVAAFRHAVACDPLSAFGGIVAVNRPAGARLAAAVLETLPFFELFIAPRISRDALAILSRRKNLRILETPAFHSVGPYDLRFVKSGVLLQDRDRPVSETMKDLRRNLRCVTRAKPSERETESLLFAWACAKVVRSNAIVLVQGKRTVGIGCGQMSRVDSVKIACEKASANARQSVLASDGFFPMPDNIAVAHSYGVRSVIQPGGSVKDSEVVELCDRYGISMVFTGKRHFKH